MRGRQGCGLLRGAASATAQAWPADDSPGDLPAFRMTSKKGDCPMTKNDVMAGFFLEMRARAIDLAAFFDRLDRVEGDLASEQRARLEKLRAAISVILDSGPDKAKRVHMLFCLPYEESWREKLLGGPGRA